MGGQLFTTALRGAGRFVRPALAAAAFVLLLLIVPGRERHPALQAADAFLADAVDVPDHWLRWTVRQQPPAPWTLLRFANVEP